MGENFSMASKKTAVKQVRVRGAKSNSMLSKWEGVQRPEYTS